MHTVGFLSIMNSGGGDQKLRAALAWLKENMGPAGTGDRVLPCYRWNLRSDLCGIVFRSEQDMAYFVLRWL